MKKPKLLIALSLLTIIIAILTNPNLEEHKQAVKVLIYSKIRENNSISNRMNIINEIISNSLVDNIVDTSINSKNFIVFSLTEAYWKRDSRIIGFGLFGNVYINGEINDILVRDIIDSEFYETHPVESEEAITE